MIQIRNFGKAFGSRVIFEKYNLEMKKGEVVCLFGPSGCGKSTLLKVISGLDPDYSGEILGLNEAKISYVFQEARLIPWLTVKENLAYVLKEKIENICLDSTIDDYLRRVKLNNFADAYPSALSGGMKQRVSIARAFAMPHDLLLLDEPFQGLDYELKNQLIILLEELLDADATTVIMVTHDLEEAKRLSDRIIRIESHG